VSEWRTVRLHHLLAEPLRNGRSVPTVALAAKGFPVLRLTAIRDGTVDLRERKSGAWSSSEAWPFLVCRGDFLIARGNGSLSLVGRGALVRHEPDAVAFPDTMIRARPDLAKVIPEYLSLQWAADGVRHQVEAMARTSAGIFKVNQRALEQVELRVPSVAEQRRIVAILEEHLSSLDAADASLAAARRRLAVLRERTARDALVGAAEPRRRPGKLAQAGTSDGGLPSLPEGWAWSRLGGVAEVVGGVTKDAKKQSDTSVPEVPYLRVANVQRGRLDLRQVATIRVAPAKVKALALLPGDVLLNEGGDRDKLARGWVWEGQIDGCIHQNHVFRARITDDRIDPYFLSWTANTFGGKWAERNGKQSVNLASISLRVIRLMPVIVPPPGLAGAIAARLADDVAGFERLEYGIAAAEVRSARLRRAVLAAAFSGRLSGRSSDTELVAELASQTPNS